MKRLIVSAALAVILVGLLLAEISDSKASVADTSIPDNEVTSNISE